MGPKVKVCGPRSCIPFWIFKPRFALLTISIQMVQCTDDQNKQTKNGGIKTFNRHLDGYKKLNVLKLSFANSFLEGKTKGTDVIPISKVDSGICTGK